MQNELNHRGPVLNNFGCLDQIGWSRKPLLDCNFEAARVYRFRPLLKYRIKRWDYYAVFSQTRFFSATIADLGYAGNIFVYTMDYESGDLHEEGLVVPFSKGVALPRNSTEGESHFENKKAHLSFINHDHERRLVVSWPSFNAGRGINANISLSCPSTYESMNIVIPIGKNRFYLNRKINCLPARGKIIYGDLIETLDPQTSLGSLDWGRGIWEYKSYWNWASASGFLSDRRTIGLNFGCGFGDTSMASENAIILENRIQKLDIVPFEYDSYDYMKPWRFIDKEGRLNLLFTPFRERIAKTNLGIIISSVHQLFGRYDGYAITDAGEKIEIGGLIGFAEEHKAKW